eukprot:6207260-Pleurochrysis_carterae.AAC.2
MPSSLLCRRRRVGLDPLPSEVVFYACPSPLLCPRSGTRPTNASDHHQPPPRFVCGRAMPYESS